MPPKELFDISKAEQKPECLYGALCQNCYSYKEWTDYKQNGTRYDWKVRYRTITIGMGAFQLFHTDHFLNKDLRYPPHTIEMHGKHALGSDKIFSRNFQCRKQKLPFNIIHLNTEIEHNENGKRIHDYYGRTTKKFQDT